MERSSSESVPSQEVNTLVRPGSVGTPGPVQRNDGVQVLTRQNMDFSGAGLREHAGLLRAPQRSCGCLRLRNGQLSWDPVASCVWCNGWAGPVECDKYLCAWTPMNT